MHKKSGLRKEQDLARGWQHRSKPLSPSHLSPHQLQQKIGIRAVTNLLQAKLTVGQPNDPYEQEADRTAAAIMRMPTPPDKNLDEDEAPLQTKPQLQAQSTTPIQVPNNFETQLAQHQTSGNPLPTSTRHFMEPRFGANFSHVRIHQTPALADAIHAKAFTHRNHIYFNTGQYNPSTHSGKVLLAHELTHVLQQTGATQASKSPILSGKDSVLQKQEADTPFSPDSLQVKQLDSSIVDPVMGSGFYQEWLTSMEKAEEVEKEARSIAQLLPDKSRLIFLANELWLTWGAALLALNKAIGIDEKRTDTERQSAIDEALDSHNNLVVISTDLEKINTKFRFLLEAKIFDFLHRYGVLKIKKAKELKVKLASVAREVGTLQRRIADAPQDIQDSLKQLGLNVAISIAMTPLRSATISLNTAIHAYSIAQAATIYLDELWGPDTPALNTFLSKLSALGNSTSGIAEKLFDGRSHLEKGAKTLGKATSALGFLLDSWEVGIAVNNYFEMYSLFKTLKVLNQNYASLHQEYRQLEPLLLNYELSIRIIDGLKQAAEGAREQADSI